MQLDLESSKLINGLQNRENPTGAGIKIPKNLYDSLSESFLGILEQLTNRNYFFNKSSVLDQENLDTIDVFLEGSEGSAYAILTVLKLEILDLKERSNLKDNQLELSQLRKKVLSFLSSIEILP